MTGQQCAGGVGSRRAAEDQVMPALVYSHCDASRNRRPTQSANRIYRGAAGGAVAVAKSGAHLRRQEGMRPGLARKPGRGSPGSRHRGTTTGRAAERGRNFLYGNVVSSLAFKPDDPNVLVTGSHDQTVKLWDLATSTCFSTMSGEKAVYGLAFSPDGQLIAAGEGNPYNARAAGAVRIYCASTGQVKRALRVDQKITWCAHSE